MNDASPPAIAKANLTTGGPLAALAPQNLDDAFRLAKALSLAGDMVPKHFQEKPEAIMAAIIRGMEIGLAPMQALSNIAVINGRASVWGDALPALMQRAGHRLDCEVTGEGDDMLATATLVRGDTGQTIVRSFSVKDAKAANLWGKAGPWQQYKTRMLSMRARTLACRDGAADALMGLQVAEEVQDYPKDITPKEGGAFTKLAQAARTKTEVQAQVDALTTGPVELTDPPEDAVEVEDGHWTDFDPEDGFPGSEAFTQGALAFMGGIPARDCPHERGTEAANDWLTGWHGARRAAE